LLEGKSLVTGNPVLANNPLMIGDSLLAAGVWSLVS
jgi:hypothetical protein